jgi:CDP-glucose 4,6-dehydratase
MTKTARTSSAAFGNTYAGKKVLLTGHTGFKGAWLAEWLIALGANVTGYSIACEKDALFRELKLADRMMDERGDVRDLPAVTKLVATLRPDFVFHLAAQPLVRQSYLDPVETFTTNVTGSINVMEAVRVSGNRSAVIMVTTDKCYENREVDHAYRETDPLGGHDPYSASKAAAEIAIACYRKSFFEAENPPKVALGSARAGNVIGGGDWAENRIVPDAIRSLRAGQSVPVRNKDATRPWQHVLDPLSGYLTLGAALWNRLAAEGPSAGKKSVCSAFNFGPNPASNQTVRTVVDEVLKHWPGAWIDRHDTTAPHEAGLLKLNIEKADEVLGWRPVWNFEDAIAHTVDWYRRANAGENARVLTDQQIAQYQDDAAQRRLKWAA